MSFASMVNSSPSAVGRKWVSESVLLTIVPVSTLLPTCLAISLSGCSQRVSSLPLKLKIALEGREVHVIVAAAFLRLGFKFL